MDARPWGQWTLVNDTFPAQARRARNCQALWRRVLTRGALQGGSRVELQLRGVLNDGEPDGGVFLDTGLVRRGGCPRSVCPAF